MEKSKKGAPGRSGNATLDRATRFAEGIGVGAELVRYVQEQPTRLDDVVASAAKRIITHPQEMLGPEGAGVVAGVLSALPGGPVKDVVTQAIKSKPVAGLIVALFGGSED